MLSAGHRCGSRRALCSVGRVTRCQPVDDEINLAQIHVQAPANQKPSRNLATGLNLSVRATFSKTPTSSQDFFASDEALTPDHSIHCGLSLGSDFSSNAPGGYVWCRPEKAKAMADDVATWR